jgi:chromosome segregation ATPase
MNAAASEREKILKAKEEALGQIKSNAETHTREVQVLIRERDRLAQESRQFQQRLEESARLLKQAQESGQQKNSDIVKQRDEALAKTEELRGAHAKEIAEIRNEAETAALERDKALAAHKEAIEAKRAQWAVFGNEYNQVVNQRDEALAQLDATKDEMEKKAEAVAKEKEQAFSKLQKSHAELEKKVAELHAKFDDIAGQNAALKAEAARIAGERDAAIRAQEDVLALPRIRPVSFAPKIVQPSDPEKNS